MHMTFQLILKYCKDCEQGVLLIGTLMSMATFTLMILAWISTKIANNPLCKATGLRDWLKRAAADMRVVEPLVEDAKNFIKSPSTSQAAKLDQDLHKRKPKDEEMQHVSP
jgi:hypothetical protein